MKRFWLILGAVLMLAQWSYAAAGGLCAHEDERSQAAAHWGHHVHTHQDASPDEKGDPGKAASADADCAFCHAASPWAAPGAARLDAAASAFPMDSVEQPLAQGRRPDPPDRPQWTARAFA